MTPRSKKYYQTRKQQSGEKKGSVSDAGYNEENAVTSKQSPKENPAPSKATDDPETDTLNSQSKNSGQ